jgi:hypothetical protein
MSNKFDFDITPEYFTRENVSPAYPQLVSTSFLYYEYYNQYIPNKIEENYKKLDAKYLSKLPFDYKEKVKKVREGMKTNQAFFTKIANLYINTFNYVSLTEDYIDKYNQEEQPFLGKFYLQLLVREWGEEGREERSKSITPVIQELKNYYDYENKSLMEKGVNVLVIGAKFGRVVYELAKLGYNVEGNEKNYSYLLVANYLFNYSKKNELGVCPRISSFCSSFTEQSVTKKHSIPDVDIISDLKNVKKDSIKVTKKEFEVEYTNKKDLFDCVVTVFGTDETKNLINFTEVVHNVLKKGGIWINMGGLNNIYSEYGGFDLTWEEWRHVIIKTGFDIKKEERPVLPYIKIEGHSLPHTLGAVFFTAQKK